MVGIIMAQENESRITGSSMGLLYPGDAGKAIVITGVVRLKNGQPYIEIPSSGRR
jgi:hypothetical protein